MSHIQKNSLRPLLEAERQKLRRLSRGQAIAASAGACESAIGDRGRPQLHRCGTDRGEALG